MNVTHPDDTPDPVKQLILTALPNGGFTVEIADSMHRQNQVVAAYSDAADLLEGLEDMVEPKSHPAQGKVRVGFAT